MKRVPAVSGEKHLPPTCQLRMKYWRSLNDNKWAADDEPGANNGRAGLDIASNIRSWI